VDTKLAGLKRPWKYVEGASTDVKNPQSPACLFAAIDLALAQMADNTLERVMKGLIRPGDKLSLTILRKPVEPKEGLESKTGPKPVVTLALEIATAIGFSPQEIVAVLGADARAIDLSSFLDQTSIPGLTRSQNGTKLVSDSTSFKVVKTCKPVNLPTVRSTSFSVRVGGTNPDGLMSVGLCLSYASTDSLLFDQPTSLMYGSWGQVGSAGQSLDAQEYGPGDVVTVELVQKEEGDKLTGSIFFYKNGLKQGSFTFAQFEQMSKRSATMPLCGCISLDSTSLSATVIDVQVLQRETLDTTCHSRKNYSRLLRRLLRAGFAKRM